MRALVYYGNRDLRQEEVAEPAPGPREVKLRIDYCGICATDIEEYLYGPVFISAEKPNPLTGRKIPLITGHEMTGTIVNTGADVEGLRLGQRAVINGILTCKSCWWCRRGQTTQCPSMAVAGFALDGGLAEYMVWPSSQVILLPEGVDGKQAALVEPAAVAYHAVRRGWLEQGMCVAVLGSGTVGLLAIQVAKHMGAQVFAVDRRQISLDLAAELGADATINTEEVDPASSLRELTDGTGPDLVIDAAGGPDTTELAVQWVRAGGRVVLVAIYTAKPQFDFNSVVATETELIGSLAYQQQDVEKVVGLIASGTIKTTQLVSQTIGLDEVVDVGFARMMEPAKDVFRILVAPSRG